MTKIKICGLFQSCDIEFVNEAKPDYIGFVFAKSRRQVTKEQAGKLRALLDHKIISVGVFVNEKVENIVDLINENIISVVQLHGQEDECYIQTLKSKTSVPIIKAVKVTNAVDIIEAQKLPVDFLLLDQGEGGTGKVFDWTLASGIKIAKPFFLAGGMNIDNVERGINELGPFAVDISSGVETNGVKDKNKIEQIIRRIQNV
ncbi:phosphoribosylanthranilate isomerase [Anaerosacchariphilus polymeriproducens]|uniref:N-(5'-phosphoribosyl)anthranilate isomerase n=1 Tax=Anaerosacchariphilus polymeriproducens TaxID=1812858 RepID=A0A371AV97_9FIRM|nr:phosphoribosylanthranilate isomerase [Anaerosacchariphilus polymeriproducens]RDU23462.1 phosphoribosylanthranilate isomerase [Anaerosacchariphilus polymeriproducens]